jgi:transglutaminase-like putative cysteine protease
MSADTSPWRALRARLAGGRWHSAAVIWVSVLVASSCVQPLLAGVWWLPGTAVVVGAVVAVGGLVRTARLPAPLQPLLQAMTLLVVLSLLFTEPEPGWGRLLPGPTDLEQLRALAAQGRDYATATVPPAPADPGLLLILVAGMGLVALAIDTLAPGLDLPGLTLIPLAALFVVPWAINDGWAPVWAFVAVAGAWFAVLATSQRDRATLWGVHARPGSTVVAVTVALAATTGALLAGGLAGISGPPPVVKLGDGVAEGTVEVDALVSMRRSLVDNDDRLILTYSTSAERPDYFRLAVLDQFTGSQWRASGGTGLASPYLGPRPPLAATAPSPAGQADYRIDVGPLGGTTLPSPAGTVASPNDFPVAWDQRTSLPVRTDGRSIEGTRITVVAQPTTADPQALRSASTTRARIAPPAETREVPTIASGELEALTREITSGAATPFDQAVALQRWFTSGGGFRYSTEVEGGTDEDALADFLTERIGYCEQFAATMALMGRTLGIPTRVVVGFTQGRIEGTQWVVRGTDAHAWPELWMGTAGWVRFEPTPGSSATTPVYTRQSSQATSPTEPTPGATAEQRNPTDAPDQFPETDGSTGAAGRSGSGEQALMFLIVALLGLVLVALPAMIRVALRAMRRRNGGAEDAYRETADTLVDLRLGDEQATPRATLAVAEGVIAGSAQDSADARASLARIQRAIEWERYGAVGTPIRSSPRRTGAVGAGIRAGGAVAQQARPTESSGHPGEDPGSLSRDVAQVRRALARSAGRRRRLLGALAPASLLRAAAQRLGGPDRDGTVRG